MTSMELYGGTRITVAQISEGIELPDGHGGLMKLPSVFVAVASNPDGPRIQCEAYSSFPEEAVRDALAAFIKEQESYSVS